MMKNDRQRLREWLAEHPGEFTIMEAMEGTGVSLKELYEIAMQISLYISSVRDMIIGGEITEAIQILKNTQEYVREKMRVYEMRQKEVSE